MANLWRPAFRLNRLGGWAALEADLRDMYLKHCSLLTVMRTR